MKRRSPLRWLREEAEELFMRLLMLFFPPWQAPAEPDKSKERKK